MIYGDLFSPLRVLVIVLAIKPTGCSAKKVEA